MRQERAVNEFPSTFLVGAKLLFVAILIVSFGPFAETQEKPEAASKSEEQPTAPAEQTAASEKWDRFYAGISASLVHHPFKDSPEDNSFLTVGIFAGATVIGSSDSIVKLSLEAAAFGSTDDRDEPGVRRPYYYSDSLVGFNGGIRVGIGDDKSLVYFRTGYGRYKFGGDLLDETSLHLGLGISHHMLDAYEVGLPIPLLFSFGYTLVPNLEYLTGSRLHFFSVGILGRW